MTLEFEIIIDYVNGKREQHTKTISYYPDSNESEAQFHQSYAKSLHEFSTGKASHFSWVESDRFKRTIQVNYQAVMSLFVKSRFLTGEDQ